MNARQAILDRIRAAQSLPAAQSHARAPDPDQPGQQADVAATAEHRTGQEPPSDLAALLAERVADYRATVHRCRAAGLADTVASALAGTRRVVAPADLAPEWLSAYQGEVMHDSAATPLTLADLDVAQVSVVTGCAVAIAETGTIILDTGAGQGRRALTLVPDHHVCVVTTDQIARSVPAGLARLADPTRPLTMISGPSATSDIELNRVEGVHGPRRLDVVLVEENDD